MDFVLRVVSQRVEKVKQGCHKDITWMDMFLSAF